MNPYNSPAARRPWWRKTPATLGVLALIAVFSAVNAVLGCLVMIAAMVLVWVLPPWRWFAKLGAMFGAIALMTLGAALTGQASDTSASTTDAKPKAAPGATRTAAAPAATTHAVRTVDYTGEPLDTAEEQARSAGFTTIDHDAADKARTVIIRGGWNVCFQQADPTAKTIDFAAVKTDEPCPAKDGGPLPWPDMPKVVGHTYNAAVKILEHAHIDLTRVTLDDVYLDVAPPTATEAAKNGDEWRVCFQDPGSGEEITSTTTVRLDLGRWSASDTGDHCPSAKDTTYKNPEDDPDHAGDSSLPGSSSDSSGSTGGGSASHAAGTSTGGSSSTTGGGSAGAVHPGAFCSPRGATGVTDHGTAMVCGPGSDGRDRWHS